MGEQERTYRKEWVQNNTENKIRTHDTEHKKNISNTKAQTTCYNIKTHKTSTNKATK